DADALRACVSERGGLEALSAERVHSELMRLLCAAGAAGALRKMFEYGLLVQLLAGVPFLGRLENLIAIEAELGTEPDPVLRLAALAIAVVEDTVRLTQRLRLSNAERKRLEQVSDYRAIAVDMDDAAVRAKLYAVGRPGCRECALIAWAASRDTVTDNDWRGLMLRIQEMSVPEFPLQGADILQMGVPRGPAVGEILGETETRWIAGDFAMTRAELLEIARGLAATSSGKT
ncbi:MAG: CCA tRNA nucleotidyltransferase, partial [Methyloligellaceae bacterium]